MQFVFSKVRGIWSIEIISGFLVLSKIGDIPRLVHKWLFLNQPKSLDATLGMPVAHKYSVVSSE